MIGLGKKQGDLYTLQNSTQVALPKSISKVLSKLSSHFFVNNVHSCTSVSTKDIFRLWHCRLGHPSSQRLALMKNIILAFNSCNPLAKQKRLFFPHSMTTSSSCFDLVHANIWGLFSTLTLTGSKYFLTLVDDYSRCTWVYLMKHKSNASLLVQSFFNMILINLKHLSRYLKLTMVLSLLLISFMLLKVLYISCLVLKHHSKMQWLKENTNTL